MKFNNLHYDILCEIFVHYVSNTMDGPFLLMLVCTKWRDLVASTPLLWSYITIDESSPDHQLKLDVALHLAADLPLKIALVLPLSTIKPFKDRLLRASSLNIHLDNIIVSEMQPKTLRDGDEAMEMMIALLKEANIRYEGPVTWYYGQAPILLSTKRMGDNVFLGQKQNLIKEECGYFRSSYPIFHTLFSTFPSSMWPRVYDTTNLFQHLKTMINLRALHLWCGNLTDSNRTMISTILFPQLSELILEDNLEDGISVSKTWILLEELVQWIFAPALEHVEIRAPVYSFLRMIRSIYKINWPSSLTLNFRRQAGHSNEDDESGFRWEPVLEKLSYLRRLNITMFPDEIADEQAMSWLGTNIVQHISPNAICTIIDYDGSKFPPNAFRGVRCLLNFTYAGIYPQEGYQIPAEITLDTLTFATSGAVFGRSSMPKCRKLCYTTHMDLDQLDSWPADLEELVSRDSSTNSDRHLSLRDAGSKFLLLAFRSLFLRGAGSKFSRLATVTCTPVVASVLINQGLLSVLRVLTLVSTGEMFLDYNHFDSLVTSLQKRLSDDPTFGSNLTQINVRYFPPWFSFLRLLHFIVQRGGQAILSVGLPGLPHRSVLTSLISVLSGIPPVTDASVYEQLVPEAYRSGTLGWPLNCFNCYNSGFESYPLDDHETCNRFINGLSVSITKDTILI